MIYKLNDINASNFIEVEQIDKGEVSFKITDYTHTHGVVESELVLNKEQLYKLIGALHSVQKCL